MGEIGGERERLGEREREIGWGLEDNVYTLRDSEVVETNCYHASMVSDSTYWTMGTVSVAASCVSVWNYVSKIGLCVCAFGYVVLVWDFDATAVSVACT